MTPEKRVEKPKIAWLDWFIENGIDLFVVLLICSALGSCAVNVWR